MRTNIEFFPDYDNDDDLYVPCEKCGGEMQIGEKVVKCELTDRLYCDVECWLKDQKFDVLEGDYIMFQGEIFDSLGSMATEFTTSYEVEENDID